MASRVNIPGKSTGSMRSGEAWAGALALAGFVLVATAQVSNMILARGLAGTMATVLAFLLPLDNHRRGIGSFRRSPKSDSRLYERTSVIVNGRANSRNGIYGISDGDCGVSST